MERPLRKGRVFLTLCAAVIPLGIQSETQEGILPQLVENSNAGDDVETLQDTTELCCLVGFDLQQDGMSYRAAAPNTCLLLKRVV